MIKFRYKRKDPSEINPNPTIKPPIQQKLKVSTVSSTLPKSEAKKSITPTRNGTLQKIGSSTSLQKMGSNSSLQKIGSTNSLQRSRANTPVQKIDGTKIVQKTATRVAIQKTNPDSVSLMNHSTNDDVYPKCDQIDGVVKNNTLPRTKSEQKPTALLKCDEDANVSSIVKMFEELFSQLQFSRERALPADEVRRALAAPFCGQRRFRLGCMADAAECFENILLRLHAHAALPARPDDMCRAPHCLPHRKFAMALVEQGLCSACGATSEPLPFTQMVHYVSASALTTQARQNPLNLSNGLSLENFGDLLKRAGGMGDVRDCPSSCGAKTQICRSLMNNPEIVSIGVVWDSERPTLEHIMDVFSTIGTTLQLKDLFHSVIDQHWASQTVHNLVGVVTYYGKHYSTFFFHTKLRLWIYFDDATVKEVGPRWEQVVEKCRKGRYQPLLLLYATPTGTPCNTESAPKTIIPFPNLAQNNIQTQNSLRRSVTPSPEKPNIGNTRRAITPNPDNHVFTQNRPPVHRPYNEYQNLAVIQDNLYGKQPVDSIDMVDASAEKEPDYISRKAVESVLNAQNAKKHQMQLHRSLSTGSTSAHSGDSIVIPDHLNVPRRRDSGNWSGDRNSTSSSSSTTMENPYLYLVGKMQQRNGSVPSSPTRKGELSSGSSGRYDAGYDSYSLSSTDSLPLQQGLKHNLQLAQIPEYQPHIKAFGKPFLTQDDCGRLCLEADQLLDKSRQTEDANDLETALVLCNAAATKARAAMDAPYNNPHMMTFARMKHNTCIMRARSLHRRILQEQGFGEKDSCIPDIRHTREGSNSSARHSRQNSRDKTGHSRQNSKEMLATTIPPVEKVCPSNKNIEIYATLPKKKSTLKKSPQPTSTIEDEEYMIYDRPSRESRSIFGRSKNKDDEKAKEKRSRSEDRSKMSKEMTLAPDSLSNAKDTLKRDKNKDEKDDKKGDKDGKPGKKQHKIRRKLLMGGLIRRKNRSMPDLTEGNVDNGGKPIDIKPLSSVDDSGLGLKGMDKNLSGMSGYLSEGHLEYSGSGSTNPNLERSKLMRKSFHGSAGKILTIAKVPPPPPLRTTSQLTGQKPSEDIHDLLDRPQYPLPSDLQNGTYYHQPNYDISNNYDQEPQSLPFLPSYDNTVNKNYVLPQRAKDVNQCFNQGMIYESCGATNTHSYQTVVTKADIHQERSPIKHEAINVYPISHVQNTTNTFDDGVDEVDCVAVRMNNLELPPYPSPPNSAIHSRQASEEFPPPPPPLDNYVPQEETNQDNYEESNSPPTGLLAQLQQKRQQILSPDSLMKKNCSEETTRSVGETWLKELQAKQAALKLKKSGIQESQKSDIRMNTQYGNNKIAQLLLNNKNNENDNINLVRNLATKFDYVKSAPRPNDIQHKQNGSSSPYTVQNDIKPNSPQTNVNNQILETPNTYITDSYCGVRRSSESSIDKQQIEEEIREVEMLNAAVNRQLSQNSCSTDTLNSIESKVDNILRTKKKSVSFCDQVILVATAEDQDDDGYIPNPILERVLKSSMNKSETCTLPLQGEKPTLKRQDSIESQKSTISTISHNSSIENPNQAEYVKIQNVSTVYQQVPTYNQNNIDHTKPVENNIQNQPRMSTNTPYQPNINNIYQSPPLVNQQNNQYLAQRQIPKNSLPISPNQLYQNYQNTQYNNNNNQSPTNVQPPQTYQQNPQYPVQQNTINKQINNTYQVNNYQQKQNLMYFPINRTQPAYQGNNGQTSQFTSTYQNNSPYQHIPTSTQHIQHNYETDGMNINKSYGKPETYLSNSPNSYNNHLSQTQYTSAYQRIPQLHPENQINPANSVYQRPPQHYNAEQNSNNPYQKMIVPNTDPNKLYPQYNVQSDLRHTQPAYQQGYNGEMNGNMQNSYVPHLLKQPQKKSVSFEAGTKGGADSPIPKMNNIAPAINSVNLSTHHSNIINGNHIPNVNSVNTTQNSVNNVSALGKHLCNLCRKKNMNPPSIYCVDCDFYMSRFKPRT